MSKRHYNFPILIRADDSWPPNQSQVAFSLQDPQKAKSPKRKPPLKLKCPSEAYEAARLVDYLRSKNIPFTHVANETTSRLQGSRNKRAGVSKGFPDYVLVLPGKILFLELKRKRGGRISPEQKQWLERLNQVCPAAIVASVAYGFEDAKKQIESFS